MKTTYYFMGHSMEKLDRIIDAVLTELELNDNHLELKNGDDIEIYADGDDWTIFDSPEYGGEIRRFNSKYLAIIEIMKMSRRGF